MSAVNQHLGINAGIVKMVCEGLNNCKTGRSKKDGCHYKFEYVTEENMPYNHKKSPNIRPRMTGEDRKKRQKERYKKWCGKAFECPKCGKTFKNRYQYKHRKICQYHTWFLP